MTRPRRGSRARSRDLGQVRPSDTSATSIYTPTIDEIRGELRALFICNTTGSIAKYRVFYDADGTTYDQNTALFYDTSLAAYSTDIVDFEEFGITLEQTRGGNLAVRTDTANALTFTLFGTISE